MPIRIPTYSRTNVGRQALRAPGIQAEPGPSTAGARALSQMGAAVASAGGAVAGGIADLAAYQASVEAEQREAKFNRAYGELADMGYNLSKDYRLKLGTHAIEGRPKVLEEYDKSYQKIRQHKDYANDPAVLERLEGAQIRDRLRFTQGVDKHMAAQSRVVYLQSHETALDAVRKKAEGAAQSSEWFEVLDYLDMAEDKIRKHAAAEGWAEGADDDAVLVHQTGTHAGILNMFMEEGRLQDARTYIDGYRNQPESLDMGAIEPILTKLGRMEEQMGAVSVAAEIMSQAENDPTLAVELLYGKRDRGELSGKQYIVTRNQTFQLLTDNEKVRHFRNNEGLSTFMLKVEQAAAERTNFPTTGDESLNNVDDEGKKNAYRYLAAAKARRKAGRESGTVSDRTEYRRLIMSRIKVIPEAELSKWTNAQFLHHFGPVLNRNEVAYNEARAWFNDVKADWEYHKTDGIAAIRGRGRSLGRELNLRGQKLKDFEAMYMREAAGARPEEVEGAKSVGRRSKEASETADVIYKWMVRVPSFWGGTKEIQFYKTMDRDDMFGGTVQTYDGETKQVDPAFRTWVFEGENLATLDLSTYVPATDEPPPPVAPPAPSLEPLPTTVPRGGHTAPDLGDIGDEAVIVPDKDRNLILKAYRNNPRTKGKRPSEATIQTMYLHNKARMTQAANVLQEKAKAARPPPKRKAREVKTEVKKKAAPQLKKAKAKDKAEKVKMSPLGVPKAEFMEMVNARSRIREDRAIGGLLKKAGQPYEDKASAKDHRLAEKWDRLQAKRREKVGPKTKKAAIADIIRKAAKK